MRFNTNYLSYKNTNILRGILAILVLIHHLYQYKFINYLHPYIGSLLQNLGFWCVACFFFLSGYALKYSSDNKKNYFNNFLKNKVLTLYTTFLLFWVIYFIYELFLNGMASISVLDIMKSLFFGKTWANGLWYLQVTIYLYLSFYISYKNNKKYAFWYFILFLLLYSVLAVVLHFNISRCATFTCFFLGIVWYDNKEKIDKCISDKSVFIIAISLLLYVFLYLLNKYIFKIWIIMNISHLFFVISLISIYSFLNINSSTLEKIGKNYSLEIYCIQFLFLNIYKSAQPIIYLVLVFISTILTSILLHQLIKLKNKFFLEVI